MENNSNIAQTEIYHIPALLQPTIDGLNIHSDGVYVDVTFGGGGHSKEIIRHLGKNGQLFSFDQDADAKRNIIDDPRFHFVHANFRYLNNFMDYYGIECIDGLIADLGVSFHHFDEAKRGFSFRLEGQLDMRMNQNQRLNAADIINTYEESRLADIFFLYGELRQARQMAKLIVRERAKQTITTTQQLNQLMTPFCGKDKEKKDLARIYQALRIEVNDELSALKDMLIASKQLLRENGRIAILTYHSLEDRLVKNFLKTGNIEGKQEKDFYGNILSPFKLINTKPIMADEQEVAQNPRARSAKLRIAEKK